jgi:tetratricopeptide (TPR) repeat protein
LSIAFGWYYVVKNPTVTNFGLPLLAVLFVFICMLLPLFILRTRKTFLKNYIFFFALFIISIFPLVQIFPLDLTVADRWFYLPLFGFLGLVGVIYEFYSKRIVSQMYFKIGGILFIILLLLFFSVRDYIRNNDWASSISLCQHDEQINTQSYLLEYCLSNELYNINHYQQAKIHAQKAVTLYPHYFLSWYTLGKIEFAQNDKIDAKDAFEKTLSYNDFGYGSEELALDLVYMKQPQAAKSIAQRYLKKKPDSAQLWYALALADYKLGNKEEAVSSAKKAYTLEPTPITYKFYYRLSRNLSISL